MSIPNIVAHAVTTAGSIRALSLASGVSTSTIFRSLKGRGSLHAHALLRILSTIPVEEAVYIMAETIADWPASLEGNVGDKAAARKTLHELL